MMRHKYPERSEAKKEQILRAAEEVFLKKGFHATSMNEIARLAKISPPHIYNFYQNKAELALAVHNSMHGNLKKQMSEWMKAGNGNLANLDSLDCVFDQKKATLMLTLMTEATRDEQVKKSLVKNFKDIEEILWDTYEVDPEDTEHQMRVELMMSFYVGTSIRQLFTPTSDREAMKKILIKVDEWLSQKKPVDNFAKFKASFE